MNMLSALLDYTDKYSKLICYGAGRYGLEVKTLLHSRGIELECFAETNPCRIHNRLGTEVRSVGDIDKFADYGWIIAASKDNRKEMLDVLRAKGVENIYVVDEQLVDYIRDEITRNNTVLKDSRKGERCFILGMGPSIGQQNLKLLANETVLSCSFCSLLDDYNVINPEYYISPPIANDPIEDEAEREECAKELYSFLDKTITSDTIILDIADKPTVDSLEIFKGKTIYYINQTGNWDEKCDYIDIAKKTPGAQTGTIMNLQLAMYMGFSDIYLLGTEHDLVKRKYGHSYDIGKLSDMGFSNLYEIQDYNNRLIEKNWKNRDLLRASYRMYEEYYLLHGLAQKMGINIYNATLGGDLDEFDRVEYTSLF